MNRMLTYFSPIAIFTVSSLFLSLLTLPVFLSFNMTNTSAITFIFWGLTFLLMLLIMQRAEILMIFVLALITRFLCVLLIPTVQTSDFLMMHQAAINASSGDFTFVNDPYFKDWAYQIGFVLYQALIIWFTGSETLALQILNVFATSISVIFVYLIGREIFNARAGIAAAFLYAVYFPTVISSALLTNQHIATFFFIASILAILHIYKSPYIISLLAGLLIALGDFFRPLSIVVLSGVSLFLIFKSWRPASKFELRQFMFIFTILFSYTATIETLTYVINYSGIYEGRLTNNNPKWKFVLGLNKDTTGSYSPQIAERVSAAKTSEERDLIQNQIIKENISNKAELLILFKNKFLSMWGDYDTIMWWSLHDIRLDKSLNQITSITQSQYFMIISLFTIGLIASLRNTNSYVLLMILALYVGAHLLVEIQTRYRYFAMPFIIIYAGYGYTIFERYVWKIKNIIVRP